MFRIKICGITRTDNARAVAAAGADAVGLNFYPKSPRCITEDTARRIIEVLPPEIVKVGLFVNAPSADVCRAFDDLRLDLIQLHGDEPPEYLAELGGRPVVRAVRMGPEGLAPLHEYLAACRRLGPMPRLVLVDALVPGSYGGTGRVADWEAVAGYQAAPDFPPLILAGGLTPKNVAQGIRTVRPYGVDTASGVEQSPGRKDPAAVEAFVEAAHAALSRATE